MSEPKQLNAGIDAPDAEVELSAEDLLELAGPCHSNVREHGSAKQAQEPARTTKTIPAVPSATARRHMPSSRLSLSLALAVAVVAGSYFVMAPSNDAAQPSTQEVRLPQPQSPAPAAKSEAEGEPVLFANPFDANEVFEFPAGTSEAEARDTVAEVLLERAMERQRHFDARVSNNR